MGKKKKGKRIKKIKKNYNKKEFYDVLCQNCQICPKPDPSFCYANLYKHEPKPFINKVFNNLREIRDAYRKQGKSMRSISIDQFKNIVCKTGICFNGDIEAGAICEADKQCYQAFRKQMGIENGGIVYEINKKNLITFKNNAPNKKYTAHNKRRKKRKKKRRVFAAYPSFFMSDNAEFQKDVKKILYGNHDSQQNQDKELSEPDPRASSGHSESGKSKV